MGVRHPKTFGAHVLWDCELFEAKLSKRRANPIPPPADIAQATVKLATYKG